ncbi:hypothetical protein [Oceanobacillus polygoni]|uniref:Uncharacterized protein n=1 Tax=Oceanobacillus polygoni TaxID=1235259 RepID=A0A9X1CJN1_9BACI|nr:hypothetical protein [Oceanobacillus polygoni]MBP2079915.1 hypothetical protein [Oceanobacillus polygoni]
MGRPLAVYLIGMINYRWNKAAWKYQSWLRWVLIGLVSFTHGAVCSYYLLLRFLIFRSRHRQIVMGDYIEVKVLT